MKDQCLRAKIKQQGCFLPLRGEPISLPFLASKGSLHSLAPSPFLQLPSQQCNIFKPSISNRCSSGHISNSDLPASPL